MLFSDFTYFTCVKRKHHLHELIHALTAPEKRYFKRLAQTWKENDNDYIELFDAIHAMPEYDEQVLRKNLLGKSFLKKLDVKKHYLYELILDALQQYHHKRMEKENAVLRVSLLLEKNLFHQASVLLDKSLEDARTYSDFLYELQLLQLQQVIVNFIPGMHKADVMLLVNEAIRNYENLNTYELLFHKFQNLNLGYFFVRNAKQKKKLDQVVEHPLLSSPKKARTLLSKVYYYRIWFLYYATTCQWEESYNAALKGYETIASHKLSRTYFGRTYLMTINNVIASSLLADEKMNELHKAHRQLEKDVHLFPNENLRLLARTRLVQYRFLALMREERMNEVRAYLPDVVAYINDNEGDIEKYKLKVFYFDVAKAYYALGERKLANKWFLGIPAPDKFYETADVYSFSHILFLLNSIEMGELRLVHQNIQTLRGQLKRWNLYYSFERFILSFIAREYIHWNDLSRPQKKEMMQDFITRLKLELDKEWGKSIRVYFDFEKWARQRLAQC